MRPQKCFRVIVCFILNHSPWDACKRAFWCQNRHTYSKPYICLFFPLCAPYLCARWKQFLVHGTYAQRHATFEAASVSCMHRAKHVKLTYQRHLKWILGSHPIKFRHRNHGRISCGIDWRSCHVLFVEVCGCPPVHIAFQDCAIKDLFVTIGFTYTHVFVQKAWHFHMSLHYSLAMVTRED